MNKNTLQKIRSKYPHLYLIGRWIYRILRPDLSYKRYQYKKYEEMCYKKFQNGEKKIWKKYGDIEVCFEAVSKQNYFLLSIGNQGEDTFMGKVFSEYIYEGDLVLDIGAQTGMFTLPFAKKVGSSGKVFAIEPEEMAFNAIVRNAQINMLNNVIPLKIAVTDHCGAIDFYVRPYKDTGSIYQEDTAGSPFGPMQIIKVNSTTVDNMLQMNLIEEPDFIKIDTEGAELLILDGMTSSVKKARAILVEIHEDILKHNGTADPRNVLIQKLYKLGFHKYEQLDQNHIIAIK